MGEFDLIERYFLRPERQPQRDSVVALGIGDDCALLQPRPYTQWAVSTDMLVQGRHFFADVDPQALGHKALAVNLSDLAACGAQPVAFTLALALPRVDQAWLAQFSQGLFALADAHGCELIGGDTTAGPLNICITVVGEVPVTAPTSNPLETPQSQALLRSGAQVGDDIYVSGTPGLARLALQLLQGKYADSLDSADLASLLAHTRPYLERPSPRVALGLALRKVASSAIDLSDGLLGDLTHVLKKSKVGAVIETEIAINLISTHAISTATMGTIGHFFDKISRSGANFALLGATVANLTIAADTPDTSPRDALWALFASGGDDYELLFTAAPAHRAAVANASRISQTPVTRIGQIEAGPALRLVDKNGLAVANRWASFDHFA